jgi:hypothetical protein
MRIPEQYKIFEVLEKEELFDICKEILQIDDNALMKNHVTFKKGTSTSRIDYIWVSQKLLYETTKVSIKEYNNTETDHNIIIAKFIRDSMIPSIELHKKKKNLKNKNTRKKYLYDQLKEEDKELITNRIEEELLKNTNEIRSNELSISEKVERYYEIINTTKNELIPNIEINLREEIENTNIKNLDLYHFIKFLTNLRRKIKKKKGIEKVKENWKIIVNHVIKTLKKWNIEEYYYIKSFTYRKILKEKYIEEINELYNIFYTKLQVKIASIKENKIKEAIERRQQDLEFNQKKMIDNVMEREFKKININRVLSTNQKGEDILIIDEEEIKNKVVDHFQNCAGTISVDKELPDYWKQEYDPNNQNTYSTLDLRLSNGKYNYRRNIRSGERSA